MKFMLLFQLDEKRWDELPMPERCKMLSDCSGYTREMVLNGHAQHGATLHPSSTATTLRLHRGKRVITDGPYAETTEVFAGYQLVECRDLDEALDIAARYPPLHAGASVEVRPVRTEDDFST